MLDKLADPHIFAQPHVFNSPHAKHPPIFQLKRLELKEKANAEKQFGP
jgi:hypothetical protein